MADPDRLSAAAITTQPAPGIRALDQLLKTFVPILAPQTFVYLNAPPGPPLAQELVSKALFVMHEAAPPSQGTTSPMTTTLVVSRETAQKFVTKEHTHVKLWPCRMITLEIQSSLEAVGFLATISAALARDGIAANCVSGFHRDYLFVSVDDGMKALTILERIKEENSQ